MGERPVCRKVREQKEVSLSGFAPVNVWRAPVGDWPPAWASAWGSDRLGLWADLTVNGVTQRLRWIEPSGPEGFAMGDPDSQLHQVVAPGFWLADTPCTQAFWVQVAEGQNNPSMFQQGAEAGQRPVEQVSWDDVQGWFEQLARHAPETAGLATLPTEVQWEYACRAGTTTAYWWGDEFDVGKANVNVTGDRDWEGSKGATTPVKRYPPNQWGLYDMHGNVLEWCEDIWRDRLDEGGATDPSDRAGRGGSWFSAPALARSAYCFGGARDIRHWFQGFRLSLRSPGQVPGPEGRAQ